MNELIIQRTRAILQSRVRRVKTVGPVMFPSACAQFLAWIGEVPILAGLQVQLRNLAADHEMRLQGLVDSDRARVDEPAFVPQTNSDTVRYGYAALAVAATCSAPNFGLRKYPSSMAPDLARIAHELSGQYHDDLADAIDAICTYALEPLFDYLDEQLDARNVTLAILRQYKDRSELLRKHRLRAMAETVVEGQKGERAIVLDLYEYLHDQGLRFIIEPVHADGLPDAVVTRGGGDEAIIDAKLVGDSKTAKRTIVSGIRQVAAYCRARSEPVGYLLVYLSTSLDVVFSAGSSDDSFPCVRMGECTVYYVLVDISDSPSASKKPKAKEIVITRDDLNYVDGDSAGAELTE